MRQPVCVESPPKHHPVLIETIARLCRRPRDLSLESFAQGAGVGLSWLGYFARSKIDDPSFNKVMAVKEHLDQLDIK